MRGVLIALLIALLCAVDSGSKEKTAKVSFQRMAEGMRDAFNCGVVVEKYLHGPLKGKDDEYHTLRQENNCEYVESVLNTLPDQH